MSNWTFLTNHGHAIVFLSANPDARLRDIADAIGITERAAQRIVKDLTDGGYVNSKRDGRRNNYSLNRRKPLRHPLEKSHAIGELLEAVGDS